MLQCRLLAAESLGAVAGASGTLRQLLGLSLRRSDCPSRALSRPSISLPSPRPSSSRQFPLNSGIARRGPQSFAPAAARREDPPPASPRRAPVPGQPRRFMSGSTVKRPLTGSLAGTPSSRLLTSAAATGPKDVVGMTWPTTAIVPQVRAGSVSGVPSGLPPWCTCGSHSVCPGCALGACAQSFVEGSPRPGSSGSETGLHCLMVFSFLPLNSCVSCIPAICLAVYLLLLSPPGGSFFHLVILKFSD